MLFEYTNESEFNQYKNLINFLFIYIYADFEYMIEKIDGFKKIPEQSFTTKESEHILSCFSLSPISSFRSIENKHDVNRGKDCMKKFCGYLIEYAMKLISFRAARIRSKLRSLLYLSRKI